MGSESYWLDTAPAFTGAQLGGLPKQVDVAVVGAGIIGVACALQLARQGKRVVVIDKQPPGHGASFGNAGDVAQRLRRVQGYLRLKHVGRGGGLCCICLKFRLEMASGLHSCGWQRPRSLGPMA